MRFKLLGNTFYAPFSLRLGNKNYKGEIVIDTGCMYTSIAIGSLESKRDAEKIKLNDFKECVAGGNTNSVYSLGVNDIINDPSRLDIKDIYKYSDLEVIKRNELCFIRKAEDFKVGSIALGDRDVNISYNEGEDSLLGMDVLQDYYCEIVDTGKGVYFYIHDNDIVSKNAKLRESIKRVLFDRHVSEIKSELSLGYSEEEINRELLNILK